MLRVHGRWLLTPYRVAIHEPSATAVLADLHLGYGEARRAGGDAVPLPSLAQRLEPLRQAHAHVPFAQLIVAGDLFEKAFAPALYEPFVHVLKQLHVRLAGLVPGNHDRGIVRAGARVPIFPDSMELGNWKIAHGDGETGPGKYVLGHWHPAVRERGRKCACYLVGANRLVLPAFSQDAAGVDVNRDPRWDDYRRIAIVGTQLIEIEHARGPRKDFRGPQR